MNISPLILLSLGVSFAFLYAVIITIGWAITRKNRLNYHHEIGLNKIELFNLQKWRPIGKYINTVSLKSNFFHDENNQILNPDKYNCYIVETESQDLPNLKKGDLIFIEPHKNKVAYSFIVPNLKNYR